MLGDTLHFFISLGELVVAVSLILIAGLIVAKIAFWAVSRSLGKLSGPPVYEDETGDCIAISSSPDDFSSTTNDGP